MTNPDVRELIVIDAATVRLPEGARVALIIPGATNEFQREACPELHVMDTAAAIRLGLKLIRTANEIERAKA